MKLSDEQLEALTRESPYNMRHTVIRDMARELIAARKVVEAARRRVADWDSQVNDPRAACFQCPDPTDIAEMRKAITAYDEATK